MSSSPNTTPLIYEKLFQLKQEIDDVAAQVNSSEQNFIIFGGIALLSQETPAECKFLRIVSWLYTMYCEAGKKAGIKWLVDRFETYDLDPDGRLKKHFESVHPLRTFFQHNLENDDSYNGKTKRTCKNWFKEQCGTEEPKKNSDWELCLEYLYEDAHGFLEAILKCINRVDQDESRVGMLEDWSSFRQNNFLLPELNNLIREVASGMGIEVGNIKKLRDKVHNNLATNKGKIRREGYDENQIIKMIITDTMLEEPTLTSPLFPDDIINEFNIPQGKQVWELLKQGREIYKNNPFLSREELLEKLRSSSDPLI